MNNVLFSAIITLMCSFAYAQPIPKLVRIEGGSFKMGSENGLPAEKPVHEVTVSSFYMGAYDVTVREFAAFIAATGYKTDAEKKGACLVFKNDSEQWHWVSRITWKNDEVGHKRDDSDWDKPVIYVSWNDAIAYCQWLSHVTGKQFRLPTEAEWEYAAGNGAKHTMYSWGNYLPGKNEEVGNVHDETTHPRYGALSGAKFKGYYDGYFFGSPVGCYTPNELGLYDMTGNVWQWCNDKYDAHYYDVSPKDNPQGSSNGFMRSFRGGSWHSNPGRTTITYRLSGTPDNRTPNLGFRVASSI